MAYFFLQQRMVRRRRRGQAVSPYQYWLGAAVALAIAGALVLSVIGMAVTSAQADGATGKMETAWDKGRGHPASVLLVPGATVTAPATVASLNPYWVQCTNKDCGFTMPGRYPIAYPIGNLELTSNCFVVGQDGSAGSLRVATTAGNAATYTAKLSSDGTTITICAAGHPDGRDNVVIWDSDPHAPAGSGY